MTITEATGITSDKLSEENVENLNNKQKKEDKKWVSNSK